VSDIRANSFRTGDPVYVGGLGVTVLCASIGPSTVKLCADFSFCRMDSLCASVFVPYACLFTQIVHQMPEFNIRETSNDLEKTVYVGNGLLFAPCRPISCDT
jgi:hypothetical protein